ncbi:MAG TPA: quercetin 2,3-dioxygenase [Candidatus Eremiobacteraceae bacterium]|nr:quercetin 2,3-dioxygenase [Candidatus Eremiobacteraceae bacterium]
MAFSIDANGGDSRWFLGTLATVKIRGEQTDGRLSIFESLLPHEAAPPLHSHPQDETFYVIEGELRVWIDGTPRRCSAGSIVCFPGGTPHTFFVESVTARVLVLSTPAGIEQFVLALSEPARELRIPDDDTYPPIEKIKRVFATFGVTILGPPPTRADLDR